MAGVWFALLLAGAVAIAQGKTAFPDAEHLPSITELPDPLAPPDGKRVQTKHDWERQRATLRDLVLHYEYGALPPIPKNVTGTEIASKPLEAANAAETEIRLTMGPNNAVRASLFLTVPAGKGPFPAILCGDMGWGRIAPEIVAHVVKRGYILAEFSRIEIAPDSAEKGGVYAAYPDYDGGRLAAWAWGYHRVADYLTTRKDVDRKRLIVTGHSRGGKAALLAGATDERIALTAPNNSGCGGAGCYRFQAEKSEDIAAILKNFPFWFQPHFADFIGRVERLPFDQHTVKALIAPRALLTTEALGDLWANPQGTQRSYLARRSPSSTSSAQATGSGLFFVPAGMNTMRRIGTRCWILPTGSFAAKKSRAVSMHSPFENETRRFGLSVRPKQSGARIFELFFPCGVYRSRKPFATIHS